MNGGAVIVRMISAVLPDILILSAVILSMNYGPPNVWFAIFLADIVYHNPGRNAPYYALQILYPSIFAR